MTAQRSGSGPHPRPHQRGTAILLVAVGVAIVAMLGLMALDAAVRFAAIREAADAATSMANDAAAAFDDAAFYADGRTDRYRPTDTRDVTAEALSGHRFRYFEPTSTDADIEREGDLFVVRVELTGRVGLPFAGSIPGLADHVDVGVTGRAVLREGSP